MKVFNFPIESFSSGERFTSNWIKELSLLGDLVWIEESEMSKVFILEGSLDFKW